MSKEIIIQSRKEQTQIALLEDRELVELYFDNPENTRTIGNIYLGRIRKLMPNIQACFIDIGQKQDAFLHFSDIADNLPELLAHLGETLPAIAQSSIVVAPESLHPGISEDFELDTEEEEPPRRTNSNPRNNNTRNNNQNRRDPRDKPRPPKTPTEKAPTSVAQAETAPKKEAPALKEVPPRKNVPAHPPKSHPPKPRTDAPKPEMSAETIAEIENFDAESAGTERSSNARKRPPRKRGGQRNQGTRGNTASENETDADLFQLEEIVLPDFDIDLSKVTEIASHVEGTSEEKTPPKKRSNRRGGNRTKRSHEESAPSDAVAEQADEAVNVSVAMSESAEAAPKPRPKRRSPKPRAPKPNASEQASPDSGNAEPRADAGSSEKSVSMAAVAEPLGSAIQPATRVHPAHYLREGQRILVKISKEPISNKGSRVTTDISLAGRFLVLVPYTNYVAVSKRIASQKERRRLRALAASLLPEGFGVIVRTVAEDRDAKSLYTDLKLLLDKWNKIEDQLKNKPNPPSVLYQDVSMASSVIRDLFTEDYDRILTDDPRVHRNIKSYVQAVAPQMVDAVKLYNEKKPVFEAVGIQNALEEAFAKRVNMPSGGYLFIEHTEAMHVIDVNSGRAGYGLTQEANSLNINLEAAHFIAKHLRLRDLGGIIVIDFIDLRNESNRKKVWHAMRKEFRKDRAVTKLLPMSDFGLMEITRQRLRPSAMTNEKDVVSGEEKPVAVNFSIDDLTRRMETWLEVYKMQTGKKTVQLQVHPLTAQYLKKGIFSLVNRWRLQKKVRVQLIQNEQVDPLQYHFIDPETQEDITILHEW